MVKNTIGRTNNGHTPLAAIMLSFIPGTLAFLVVGADKVSFQEVAERLSNFCAPMLTCAKPIAVFGRFYTGPVLCIYASECIAFLRFING